MLIVLLSRSADEKCWSALFRRRGATERSSDLKLEISPFCWAVWAEQLSISSKASSSVSSENVKEERKKKRGALEQNGK